MNKPQERYWILKAATVEELESLVDDAMQSDWNPIGGVSVSVVNDVEEFFQATTHP